MLVERDFCRLLTPMSDLPIFRKARYRRARFFFFFTPLAESFLVRVFTNNQLHVSISDGTKAKVKKKEYVLVYDIILIHVS